MRKLIAAWRIQARVVYALMVRDLMMRYGRDNIGFAWVILEPMILTAGVMVIWSVMGSYKEGIKIIEVVFTGYMPLTLWRHLTNGTVNMYRMNIGLLYHRRVTLFDIFMAREALEFIGTSTALLVIYSVLLATGLIDGAERFDLLFLGWFMMAWIAIAFGGVMAATTEKYEVAERFVQPLQYLNIPLSGAFFFSDWLPPWGQRLLSWHPMSHCYEVFRAGYFGDSVVTHYNLPYFTAFTLVLSFFGVRAIARTRKHIRLS